MMEATPAAPLAVVQAELALELLVVALDTPADLGRRHEFGQRRRRSLRDGSPSGTRP